MRLIYMVANLLTQKAGPAPNGTYLEPKSPVIAAPEPIRRTAQSSTPWTDTLDRPVQGRDDSCLDFKKAPIGPDLYFFLTIRLFLY